MYPKSPTAKANRILTNDLHVNSLLFFQVFVDATFGAGGHTSALLMAAKCSVYALDRDPAAVEIAQVLANRPEFKDRLFPMHGKFSEMHALLRGKKLKDESIDGMLLDVGASSMQFDDPDRGFSLSQDGPLDMRMDSTPVQHKKAKSSFTAADVVNSIDEGELAAVLREYGQEKEAGTVSLGTLPKLDKFISPL